MKLKEMSDKEFFTQLINTAEFGQNELCRFKAEEEGLSSYLEPVYSAAIEHARTRIEKMKTGLAALKPEGVCFNFGSDYVWDPRSKAKAKYINSLPKYRQSSASKAWDKALAANAEAVHNEQT